MSLDISPDQGIMVYMFLALALAFNLFVLAAFTLAAFDLLSKLGD